MIHGFVPTGSQHDGKVKVIDLRNPGKTCPTIPKFPMKRGMFGIATGCDEAMVCGGYNPGGSNTDKCYRLKKNGAVSHIQITEIYSHLYNDLIF